jgi:phosphoribosyl 1,2-cyclic phosphodiesterase
VGRLVLTHHAPDRDDHAIDELATRYASPTSGDVVFAHQGDAYLL